ncbi:MAG TPA: chitin-binding protein, partial [Chryseobacterium indologenes]|nr:chitin-binding protein [Chryseobacterium indologenes]
NIQTADRWKKTNITTGVNSFIWKYLAYHATTKWHYYMTKQGWDPNKP